MTSSPQLGLRAHKGTLWDPAAEIAPGQVAGNSNLKLGDRPRVAPPLYSPNGETYCEWAPGVLHILAECGALKGEGPEGPPREHRASGVSCRTRRHLRAEAEGKLVSLRLWARMPLGPTATSLYGGKLIMTAGLGPGPGSGGSESGCH